MSQVNIKKRGNVYQYQFEIAPQGGKRKFINKSGFKTKAEAQEAGIVTINYGVFINTLISFLIVAMAVFILVKFINKLKNEKVEEVVEEAPTTKECPFCCSTININAKKCPNCTSEV